MKSSPLFNVCLSPKIPGDTPNGFGVDLIICFAYEGEQKQGTCVCCSDDGSAYLAFVF
jgi:hypothetical protein